MISNRTVQTIHFIVVFVSHFTVILYAEWKLKKKRQESVERIVCQSVLIVRHFRLLCHHNDFCWYWSSPLINNSKRDAHKSRQQNVLLIWLFLFDSAVGVVVDAIRQSLLRLRFAHTNVIVNGKCARARDSNYSVSTSVAITRSTCRAHLLARYVHDGNFCTSMQMKNKKKKRKKEIKRHQI